MSLPPGLAVAHASSPYLTVYDQTNDVFIKLADPASLPAGTGHGVAWTHTNSHLAIAHSTTPYITLYSRDGDTLTKVADPDVLPPGGGWTAAFSPDGQHLAVGHDGAPYLTLYKRDVDAFTKLADVATLNARVVGLTWADTADGVYLAVAVSGGNKLVIYKRSGDTFTPLADPDVMPLGTSCYGCSFTADGVYLAVTSSSSPYLILYKRTVDAFAKLADADVMPPAAGKRPAFSPDGTYLAVPGVADSGRDSYIYKRATDTFTKLAQPDAKNGPFAEEATWSPDSIHLAIISQSVSTGTQRVTLYKRDADAFTKLLTDAPDVQIPNTGYGGAFMYAPPPGGLVSPYVELTLVDRNGTAQANVSPIKWAFFDQTTPDTLSAPVDQGAFEETDGSGILGIQLINTTLIGGQVGFLVISDTGGDPAVASNAFAGPVTVL